MSRLPAAIKRFVITQRLRADERAEGHALSGDFHIPSGIVHNLNEQSLVGAAFVELSR